MSTKSNSALSRTLALGAMFTAAVIVLQLLGSFIRFGTFSISLVLVPIVVGAAMCGPWIGGWLGFVFGMVVLISGDAGPFLAVSVPGTVLTVLLKGTLCGLAAGCVYRLIAKHNVYAAVLAAAVVCPAVNTGVFLLGCAAFFLPTLSEWAGGGSVWKFMLLVLVGGNFLFELGFNVVLSPIIVRLLRISKKLR
ncbi:MAG: ECF transporter S component [Clostridia bacterium]|nr:ECF transporter S component [Clostridia bacterium]